MSQAEFNLVVLPFTAALSMAGSSAVLLTAILFPEMRRKNFSQLIFIVSLCDLIGSISATWGFPKDTSPLCPAQGAIRIFFYRSTWLWSTALAYQLYCTIIYGRILIKKFYMHVIVWSISTIMELLPLSTNSYGQDDQFSGKIWCSISGSEISAGIWILLVAQLPVVICAALASYWTVVMHQFVHERDLTTFPQITAALSSLRPYPIAMILTWTPNSIFGPLVNFRGVELSSTTITILACFQSLASSFGFLLALIFFAKNRDARIRWHQLFTKIFGIASIQDEKDTIRALNPMDFIDTEDENYNYYSTNHSNLSIGDLDMSNLSVYNMDGSRLSDMVMNPTASMDL